MAEGSDELAAVEVVQICCSIERGRHKETHVIADEDGGHLTLMVVQSFEYKPWVLHLLPI
jgi:hypothetical protein